MESNVTVNADAFASVQQLIAQINESHVQEILDAARDFNVEERQLLVDTLSMVLDKPNGLSNNRAPVRLLLTKLASSANVFARGHTLATEHISLDNAAPPGVYKIQSEPPARVKVLRQSEKDTSAACTEELISWAHLLHPNILSLYAVFLEGEEGQVRFVTPCMANVNICEYTKAHPEVPPLLLFSDVVNGLAYLHELDMVHGRLRPPSVLISEDGRAFITGPDATSEIGGFNFSVRYSAPESLEEDDTQPTKEVDIWSLACLGYEVLSGNTPFCQISNDFKVSSAITRGSKSIRPGQEGVGGHGIGDTIWKSMFTRCWEYDPKNRPPCSKVQQVLLGMDIRDDRPEAKLMVTPEALKGSIIDIGRARAILLRTLSSDQPSSVQAPEHLHSSLSSLVRDGPRRQSTQAAAKKLNPDETQTLVDFVDLVIQDLPGFRSGDPFDSLISNIMDSTHIFPQCYKLNGVQYDPTPIEEGQFGKAYKGRGLSVRVNIVTASSNVAALTSFLAQFANSSHPNVIPFHGIFHEGLNESPRFCLVTPFFNNGSLYDYAYTLPQKSRMPLISDTIDGLSYLHGLDIGLRRLDGSVVRVSNEGRPVINSFGTSQLFITPEIIANHLRFMSHDGNPANRHGWTPWAFGCLCYSVLSRKLPYYQYIQDAEVRSAVAQGECPIRPDRTDNDMDEIDNQFWDLITKCCVPDLKDRPEAPEIQKLIANMEIEDDRPGAKGLLVPGVLALRSRPNVDFDRVKTLLDKIQASLSSSSIELLQEPLSKLVKHEENKKRIKGVANAIIALQPEDIRALVDFFDQALNDHISVSEERNRVLALLSRVTSSTHIFPTRHELKDINYSNQALARGGFGTVYRGSDLNVCVKVMTQVDPKALTQWVKELILWAHSSHPNVLPFYGVFLETAGGSRRICLVSPFMKNGNLHTYAPRLPQKSRLPLVSDVVDGLNYIHQVGIVHGDLKGSNVLISDEGRALITDFGTSQITTATAATNSIVSNQSTLRFAAPEVVLGDALPGKEGDSWSFGCLFYEALSRKSPYYQYQRDIQVQAALARKEPPKRPGPPEYDPEEMNEWDYDDEQDWDDIDDKAWNVIEKCCAPEPGDRLKIPAIKELIVDMKIWDDRPPAKAVLGTEILELKSTRGIDLTRVGELLEEIQTVVDSHQAES